jgi:hypothetical protein
MTKRFFVLFVLAVIPPAMVQAGDWPQYRADAARTGYVSEQLPEQLSLAGHTSRHMLPLRRG